MRLPLRQGSIVWATIPDPTGRNPKRRPAMVYTPTEEITEDGMIDLVAITTQVRTFPAEISVPLPWQRGGHPKTKLSQRCEAIATCLVTIPTTSAEPPFGLVPLQQKMAILQILQNISNPPQGEIPTS